MRGTGIATVVAALALLAAGCGGSNEADSEEGGPTAPSGTTTISDPVTTDGAPTGSAALTGKCKDLVDASQNFSAAVAAGNTSDNLSATAESFDEFAKEAPEELREDLIAIRDVVTRYAKELADLDLEPGAVPSAAQIEKLAALAQSIGTEEVQKATAAIAEWTQENCVSTP